MLSGYDGLIGVKHNIDTGWKTALKRIGMKENALQNINGTLYVPNPIHFKRPYGQNLTVDKIFRGDFFKNGGSLGFAPIP
jgi:hypothetical protein